MNNFASRCGKALFVSIVFLWCILLSASDTTPNSVEATPLQIKEAIRAKEASNAARMLQIGALPEDSLRIAKDLNNYIYFNDKIAFQSLKEVSEQKPVSNYMYYIIRHLPLNEETWNIFMNSLNSTDDNLSQLALYRMGTALKLQQLSPQQKDVFMTELGTIKSRTNLLSIMPQKAKNFLDEYANDILKNHINEIGTEKNLSLPLTNPEVREPDLQAGVTLAKSPRSGTEPIESNENTLRWRGRLLLAVIGGFLLIAAILFYWVSDRS